MLLMICTSPSDEFETVIDLELGADDVVRRPVGPRELLARTKALLRRAVWERDTHRCYSSAAVRFRELTIDIVRQEVTPGRGTRPAQRG
jgi:DNA-binding response OmpR family regulator